MSESFDPGGGLRPRLFEGLDRRVDVHTAVFLLEGINPFVPGRCPNGRGEILGGESLLKGSLLAGCFGHRWDARGRLRRSQRLRDGRRHAVQQRLHLREQLL